MHAYAAPDVATPLYLTTWHVFEDGRFLAVPSLEIKNVEHSDAKAQERFGSIKAIKRRIEDEGEDGDHSPKKKAKTKTKIKKAKKSAYMSKVSATWRGAGQFIAGVACHSFRATWVG